MDCRRMHPGWLGLVAWLAGAAGACADDGELRLLGGKDVGGETVTVSLGGRLRGRSPSGTSQKSQTLLSRLALESMPADCRARVRGVLERPTLHASGPLEAFHGQPEVYHHLLDHPDRAVRMWRKLGAVCTEIEDRGGGRFGWRDDQGSDVHWDTVLRTARQRVWYAEGSVRPGQLLPLIHVRAVFVLHVTEGRDGQGRSALRHQGELVLHTDSRAAHLAARVLGASAPHVAEQYVGQIQTFFAALAWHLDEHPEKGRELLGGE